MSATIAPVGITKVWMNGEVVDGAHARVSVFDRGFLYGDALFETFTSRWAGDRALHLARLARGCAQMGLGLPDGVDAAIDATLRALGASPAWVRVVVTRGGDEHTLGVVPPARQPGPG